MAIFAVLYRYRDDTEALDAFRAEHREFLNTSGWTLLSGPLAGPAGALLLVAGESTESVEAALDADPFAREGLIAERVVRPFDPVGGDLASAFSGYRTS